MSMRYLGGFITASYNPLKVPNAPTIDSVTAGVGQVSVAFTAPTNVGGSAITSFTVLVTDSSSGATFSNTGSASPIIVTGLTFGETYTAKVLAVNSYGPSAFSAPSGGVVPIEPKLYSWGDNTNGQLGQNTTTNLSNPTQVGALIDWSQVSAGVSFCVAVKTNSQLWSWGLNTNGQLGQGDIIARSSPVQVGALTDWSQVSGGFAFCAAVKTNGQLWSWGFNNLGQLGQGDIIARSSPVQVGALTDWSQISASGSSSGGGNEFCAAIKTNGSLWTWGNGSRGKLGLGNVINQSSPVQVSAGSWAQVSAGGLFCAAIRKNGRLFTWGDNGRGQLGQNIAIATDRSAPTQVGALTDWLQVSAGSDFCAAVKTNGTLWTWGEGSSGRLGLGNLIDRSSPVQVGALTDWSQVSAGSDFCAAIKTNGTLWTWGSGSDGKLGQNNVVFLSSPVQVGALTTWGSIGQGSYRNHNVAITKG